MQRGEGVCASAPKYRTVTLAEIWKERAAEGKAMIERHVARGREEVWGREGEAWSQVPGVT